MAAYQRVEWAGRRAYSNLKLNADITRNMRGGAQAPDTILKQKCTLARRKSGKITLPYVSLCDTSCS